MRKDELTLVPHDFRWAEFYRRESERLRDVLGSTVLEIEHIGSTAVPDLLAKPIIDIGMTVESASGFGPCIEPIVLLGYTYRGQNGPDPLRRYFVLEDGALRLSHLHLWTRDAEAWREAIWFRNLLREDPSVRSAYESEKLRVADEVGWSKTAYSLGKGAFIERLLESRPRLQGRRSEAR